MVNTFYPMSGINFILDMAAPNANYASPWLLANALADGFNIHSTRQDGSIVSMTRYGIASVTENTQYFESTTGFGASTSDRVDIEPARLRSTLQGSTNTVSYTAYERMEYGGSLTTGINPTQNKIRNDVQQHTLAVNERTDMRLLQKIWADHSIKSQGDGLNMGGQNITFALDTARPPRVQTTDLTGATNQLSYAERWYSLSRELKAAIRSVDTRFGLTIDRGGNSQVVVLLPDLAYDDYQACAQGARAIDAYTGRGVMESDRTFRHYQQMWFSADGMLFIKMPYQWFFTIGTTLARALILPMNAIRAYLPNLAGSLPGTVQVGGAGLDGGAVAEVLMSTGVYSPQQLMDFQTRFADPLVGVVNGMAAGSGIAYSPNTLQMNVDQLQFDSDVTLSRKLSMEIVRFVGTLRALPHFIQEWQIAWSLLNGQPQVGWNNPQTFSVSEVAGISEYNNTDLLKPAKDAVAKGHTGIKINSEPLTSAKVLAAEEPKYRMHKMLVDSGYLEEVEHDKTSNNVIYKRRATAKMTGGA